MQSDTRVQDKVFRGWNQRQGKRGTEVVWGGTRVGNRGLRGYKGLVPHKQAVGQDTCLAMPCATSAQPVLASHLAPFLIIFLCVCIWESKCQQLEQDRGSQGHVSVCQQDKWFWSQR